MDLTWQCAHCPLASNQYQDKIASISEEVWFAFSVQNRLEQGRPVHGMSPKLWELVDMVSSMSHKVRMAFDKRKEKGQERDYAAEGAAAAADAAARRRSVMGR